MIPFQYFLEEFAPKNNFSIAKYDWFVVSNFLVYTPFAVIIEAKS